MGSTATLPDLKSKMYTFTVGERVRTLLPCENWNDIPCGAQCQKVPGDLAHCAQMDDAANYAQGVLMFMDFPVMTQLMSKSRVQRVFRAKDAGPG